MVCVLFIVTAASFEMRTLLLGPGMLPLSQLCGFSHLPSPPLPVQVVLMAEIFGTSRNATVVIRRKIDIAMSRVRFIISFQLNAFLRTPLSDARPAEFEPKRFVQDSVTFVIEIVRSEKTEPRHPIKVLNRH